MINERRNLITEYHNQFLQESAAHKGDHRKRSIVGKKNIETMYYIRSGTVHVESNSWDGE